MKVPCDKCGKQMDFDGTVDEVNDMDEVICHNCEQNRAEDRWERMCEDFHDGGSQSWPDAERKRMEEARKLK